jgi:hypothetical protein
VNTGISDNAAFPYQSASSTIDKEFAPTAAENTASDAMLQIAELLKGSKSKEALTAQEESNPEVTGAATLLNDINAQVEGVTNEMLALQNEANYTIPNQAQENATGRGMTTGGLAPLTASELRKNQIKQGAVASKALTLKSALYAAQGKYNLAKSAADRAATIAFDNQEREINWRKGVIEALQPQLTRDQQARAAKIQAGLADRELKMNWGREDAKTGQGMIAATAKFYPDDPAAQYAMQQASQIPLTDPDYLRKVTNILGRYQQDPNSMKTMLLDQELKRQQIQSAIADRSLTFAQIQKLAAETGKTEAEVAAAMTTANQDQASAVSLVNDILSDDNFRFMSGEHKLNPFTYIPGNTANPIFNKGAQLAALLALENRAKLKGSGAVSDYESRILNQSSSSLGLDKNGRSNLPQEQLRKELKKVAGILTSMSGLPVKVKITAPTGEFKYGQLDRATINDAALGGYLIEYQ